MTPGTPRKVLVIEDYDAVAEIESLLASMEGYDVVVTRAGDEGLARFAEIQPDLVILDLMLPGGVSGEQVLEAILADNASTARVLVVSALVNPALRRRLEADPRVATLAKPFLVRDLSERIHSLIERDET